MRKVLCIQSDWGEAHASTVMIFGKSVISCCAAGSSNLNKPNHRCPFTVSPKSQPFIALAHLFTRDFEELRGWQARSACQHVAFTVRN